MLDTERAIFGDRCPKGFSKINMLGKGGVAIVWLCQLQETGERLAVKQFPKRTKGVQEPSVSIEIDMHESLKDA